MKKSILRPILPTKKTRLLSDDGLMPLGSRPRRNELLKSPSTHEIEISDAALTDVLSAAHALLPNQSPMALQDTLARADTSYGHIDTPSRPLQPDVTPSPHADSGSVSSMSIDERSKPKFFPSFGKKSAKSHLPSPSSDQSSFDA